MSTVYREPALPRFQQAWEGRQEYLVALAQSVLNDWQFAEDVVQEVYLRLYSMPGPATDEQFHRWICVVVRHAAIDKYRQRQRQRWRELPLPATDSSPGLDNMPAPGPGPRTDALQKDEQRHILQQCSPAEREILQWRADGNGYSDIAALLLQRGDYPTLEKARQAVYAAIERIRQLLGERQHLETGGTQ